MSSVAPFTLVVFTVSLNQNRLTAAKGGGMPPPVNNLLTGVIFYCK
jgi:hypothetical protein